MWGKLEGWLDGVPPPCTWVSRRKAAGNGLEWRPSLRPGVQSAARRRRILLGPRGTGNGERGWCAARKRGALRSGRGGRGREVGVGSSEKLAWLARHGGPLHQVGPGCLSTAFLRGSGQGSDRDPRPCRRRTGEVPWPLAPHPCVPEAPGAELPSCWAGAAGSSQSRLFSPFLCGPRAGRQGWAACRRAVPTEAGRGRCAWSRIVLVVHVGVF